MKKKLVIPLEVKNRELDGACRLSIPFLIDGWTIYIGQKQQIFPFIPQFKECLWFLKSIVPGEISLLKKIKSNNNKISTLDVEGLVTHYNNFAVISRFSKETIKISDFIFFWGKHYQKRVKKYFNISSKKLFPIGSPIADGWKKKYKNKNSKPKKKILIATSFTLVNSYRSNDHIKLMLDNVGPISKDEYNKHSAYLKNLVNLAQVGFDEYKKLLDKIFIKYNNFKFFIRPHPGEDKNFWQKYISKYKNVEFDNKAKITDSLKDVSHFIHFNSTSFFAAEINKINTFMYFPKKKFPELFKLISPEVVELSNIITEEKKFLNLKNLKPVKKNKNYSHFLSNFSYKSHENSSNKIFSIINKNNFYEIDRKNDPFNLLSFLYYFIYKVKHFLSFILGHIGIKRFKLSKFRNKKVSYYKWQPLKEKEIFDIFKSIRPNNIDLKYINIKRHFFGMYKIYYKKK